MPIIRFSNFHKYIYLFVLIGKKTYIRAQLHYRKKCCARWSIIICILPTVEYNVENQYNILHAVRSARVKVPEAWKEIHWLLNGVMNHVKEKRSDEKKRGEKYIHDSEEVLDLKNWLAPHTLGSTHQRQLDHCCMGQSAVQMGLVWAREKKVCVHVRVLLMLGSITVEWLHCHWLNRPDCLLWQNMGLSYPKGRQCRFFKQKKSGAKNEGAALVINLYFLYDAVE